MMNLTDAITHQWGSESLLQGPWDYLRFNYGDYLRSPLFPVVFALSIDYFWVALFTFIDLFCYDMPFIKEAKIQKHIPVTWKLVKETLSLQLLNQFLWIWPMALVQIIWVPEEVLPEKAPSLFEMCWQNLLFFCMFDTGYFAFHVMSHKIRWLYRWCHSVHHMYSSPFAAAAQHLHPFELFFTGTFITCCPWPFKPHCLTYWVWFVIAQTVSYEVHLGYDFPFMLHRFLPFYAGAPAHDMHHVRPLTCFQPWFNHLDKLFGYYISYDDVKKMNKAMLERYGKYSDEDVKGLKQLN
ncbi:unnamed protein product [Bursaphelenchus okinawaensis]|uniref:Fatty acid hydroxylase domain-containing protein n=1 Tax=Bursaphelenchus okinawaensis TaxID=465554 RepID=A0A811LIC8_9BILA|nr:unnamed protein product [Bursaphelenchus okinawaensis]CAG9123784.1 unnamed protein product [Bursaphelenchus okinawaensis]